jgi:hypothetical protein
MWIKAELFLRYHGVNVYRTYRNDDLENVSSYYFTCDGDVINGLNFDVRDLPIPGDLNVDTETDAGKRALIARAIEDGDIDGLPIEECTWQVVSAGIKSMVRAAVNYLGCCYLSEIRSDVFILPDSGLALPTSVAFEDDPISEVILFGYKLAAIARSLYNENEIDLTPLLASFEDYEPAHPDFSEQLQLGNIKKLKNLSYDDPESALCS